MLAPVVLFVYNRLEHTKRVIETLAKNELAKAKTDAKKAAAQKTIEGLIPAVKELYQKALTYMKENAINIDEECGYQEWDESVVRRVQGWIDVVATMNDPKVAVVNESVTVEIPNAPSAPSDLGVELPDDAVPF